MKVIRFFFGFALGIFLVGLAAPGAQAQTGTVQGTVVDAEGLPLPGVNVIVAGTQTGSSTGPEGTYTFTVAPGTYTINATFIGYETATREGVEVAEGETTQVDFTLQQSEVALEEVVVIGYGEQEARDLTGSVARVDGERISEVSTPSVAQSLQGQVAGVQVTPSTGEPGSQPVIRIRGVGTLNNASPLFVVDGMLTDDISYLSPKDVESVNVLKDASATAIYGSRGANGVIIVTTKKGVMGQDTRFNLDVYYGVQEVMNEIDLVSAQQYAQLANETVLNEEGPDAALPFPNPQSVSGETDWQDVALRAAPIQSYQLSAQGGSGRVAYNISGNYISEAGIVEKSEYERASLRLNTDYDLTESVSFGQNLAFTYRTGVDAPSVISTIYRADPTIAPRDADGNFNDAGIRASGGNAAATIFYHRNKYAGTRFVGNVFAEVSFMDALTFRSSLGIDFDRRTTRNFDPEFFVSPAQQNSNSDISVSEARQNSWLWENTLSYDRVFGDHSVETVAGVTTQEYAQESLGGRRSNVLGESESLWYLNAGGADSQTNFNSASHWRMLSFLGRVNYSYRGRYLLTVSGRADGSSRFGSENRFGYFPSFALAWRASDEPFLEDADWLSNLKLRGSWGRTGNDKIGAYPGIPVVGSNLNAVFGQAGTLALGATPIELANPGVAWEETTQTDLAVEFGLFNERLTGEVDYYNRVTGGILVRVPIPDYVGVNVEPFVNAAEVRNRGFDLNLSFQGNAGGFTYQVGANGSTISNEVLALGDGREEIFGGGLVNEINFTTKTIVGQPIGTYFGYKVDGIYQNQAEIDAMPASGNVQPGDFRFVDVNSDGQITPDDRTFIGSPIPNFVYGFNLNVGWKGLNLSAFFSGQTGNQVFNAKKAVRFGLENFETSFLDRWNGEGTSESEPRVTNGGWNYQVSEWYLTDGDFLKLRNLRLAYALPAAWMEPAGVTNAQIYANGTNLFTLTGYNGYTPEVGSGNVFASGLDTGLYPIARTITVGVSATF